MLTGPCNDLWVLPSGNLLFNTGDGVMEVRRDKKVAFSFESKSEIYACQRLANGNTLIGECNAGRLIESTFSRQVVFQLAVGAGRDRRRPRLYAKCPEAG